MKLIPKSAYLQKTPSLKLPKAVLSPDPGIGHRASGIGHRASGIGHRASGIGHRANYTLLLNNCVNYSIAYNSSPFQFVIPVFSSHGFIISQGIIISMEVSL